LSVYVGISLLNLRGACGNRSDGKTLLFLTQI
jgi:hypothetical protein